MIRYSSLLTVFPDLHNKSFAQAGQYHTVPLRNIQQNGIPVRPPLSLYKKEMVRRHNTRFYGQETFSPSSKDFDNRSACRQCVSHTNTSL